MDFAWGVVARKDASSRLKRLGSIWEVGSLMNEASSAGVPKPPPEPVGRDAPRDELARAGCPVETGSGAGMPSSASIAAWMDCLRRAMSASLPGTLSMLSIAALTSAISLLEVAASYFIDRWNWSRPRAALTPGGIIFLVGILVAFSMSDGFLLASWTAGFGMSLFDTFDFVASNWLLPAGGMLIAIYAGWFLPARIRNAELSGHGGALVGGWLFLLRFVAPAMVLLVLAQKIGLFDANELLHAAWN